MHFGQWSTALHCTGNNNNNNNDIQDNVYGAVIMAKLLRVHPVIWWMYNGAKRPPTQDQARRLRLWVRLYSCQNLHPPSPISKAARRTELPVAVHRQLKVWPFRWSSHFGDHCSHFLNFCHFLRSGYAHCRRRLTKPWNVVALSRASLVKERSLYRSWFSGTILNSLTCSHESALVFWDKKIRPQQL